jgi:signal transduction histidine kinase/ActR/RegA family two-component response regulator
MRWPKLSALAIALILPCAAVSAASSVGAEGAGSAAISASFDRSIAATKAAMMINPQRALDLSETALKIVDTLPDSKQKQIAIATAEWLQGEALIGINAPDRARPIIEKAVATVERAAPDTKLDGDLMRSRGALAAMAGNVQQALADYQRAHEIFRKAGVLRSQAIALQDIGEIYLDAGDYQRVLDYYRQSAEVFSDDPYLLLTTHNNRAEVLRVMKRFPEAIAEFRAALVIARKIDSPLLETRILTNLSLAQVAVGDLAGADQSVARAMRLSASGEAHGWQSSVFGAAAKIAATRGHYAEAAALLGKAFAGADLAKTAMPYREFHELGSAVYEKVGDQRLALAHLRAFQRLDSEARNLSSSANAQLMAARFDFANQNLKISTLKQGQLQRDIEIERQRSTFRTVILGGLLGAGGIVLALLLVSYLSIRKSRNEVRAANDTLTRVNTKLEKALQAKTEFLATTSHEIRTPLNGILGMTQVLLADSRVPAEFRDKVEVVHGAGEAMRALVDDILDVAKMETGQVSVAHEDTDLSAILRDAAKLWSGQAESKGITLTLARSAPAVPARILSDEARLRQIVYNLMSNAVKFTLDGAVELAAEVETGDAGETLVIRVTDTGIGIAEDQHELIFEAFRQVDSGVSRRFGGTGLGLSICRSLSAAMGGEISVESHLGTGSIFTLRLPLTRLAAAPAAQETGAPTGLASARMLIVEHNALNQSILRAVLGGSVGEIEIADSGEAAIEALEAADITHVLVEAGSAARGGQDMVKALRMIAARARERGALCSILCAASDAPVTADAIAIGASQVILKPIAPDALIAALRAAYPPPDARVAHNDAQERSAA